MLPPHTQTENALNYIRMIIEEWRSGLEPHSRSGANLNSLLMKNTISGSELERADVANPDSAEEQDT